MILARGNRSQVASLVSSPRNSIVLAFCGSLSSQRSIKDSLIHGDEIGFWSVGKNVVNGGEDVTAPGAKHADAFTHFLSNLLGSAKRQRMLSVHTAAPENQLIPIFRLDSFGIHTCR